MRLFKCSQCEQVLYFENTGCLRCGSRLGFFADTLTLEALEPDTDVGAWRSAERPGGHVRFCANAEHSACNWVLPAEEREQYCRACRHNRTIPDLGIPERLEGWRRVEAAKRRLFYSLLRLRLPTPSPNSGDPQPLSFDFLAETRRGPKVLTGHDNGHITIALSEADDLARERLRIQLGEPYRTLLGHFRHEIGHYYWDRLVRDAGEDELARCRALFGDDRLDYGEALKRHYAQGAPDDWQASHVSSYATMHAWEDWAETWAHYLHMVDTLEMASAFGIRIAPDIADDSSMDAQIAFDPIHVSRIQRLVDAWLPLTYALNSLNRAMGQPDVYPFVIPPAVIAKMDYIHALIRRQGLR
ncbi:zinc-binding metallopeptidase family protein [Luteimonas deserti]|uniref:Putative zinc-binding peptidase n=1 Tax=Luteimonas deserti TaxID=2752306 RepID=A0A7Z0QQM5_9GAMM|nr:putative zinc-binding peptidase [Luteimonas deserti]NYZ63009.1 putative zinc-binding peptidase [Luteimonas deserti]